MNVDILCPQCGTLFTVRRELLGKRTKCIKCGSMFVIAEPPAGSAVRAAASPTMPPPNVFQSTASPSPLPASQMPAAELPEIITTPRSASASPPPVDVSGAKQAADFPFPPHEFASSAADADAPRFNILHLIARIYEVLSILALIAAAVLLVLSFVSVVMNPTRTVFPALMATGLSIFWAISAAMMFLFMAQSIRLGLQIEKNTRDTCRACERLADHLCAIERDS